MLKLATILNVSKIVCVTFSWRILKSAGMPAGGSCAPCHQLRLAASSCEIRIASSASRARHSLVPVSEPGPGQYREPAQLCPALVDGGQARPGRDDEKAWSSEKLLTARAENSCNYPHEPHRNWKSNSQWRSVVFIQNQRKLFTEELMLKISLV